MKIKKNKKGFTLLELMISIAILIILMMFSYAPYSLYQNKAKLKLATREVAQSIYDSRNMAISGKGEKALSTSSDLSNKSIGIFLDSADGKNDRINYYFYDFKDFQDSDGNFDSTNIVYPSLDSNEKRQIQDGVLLNGFSDGTKDYESLLIFFEAVSGDVEVFGFNGTNKEKITTDTVKIKFSFRKSTSSFLQKEITYYIKTNIVDYK